MTTSPLDFPKGVHPDAAIAAGLPYQGGATLGSPAPARIEIAQSGEFKIPAPKGNQAPAAAPAPATAGPTSPAAPVQAAAQAVQPPIRFDAISAPPISPVQMVSGGAAFLLLAVLFLMVKISITRSLQSRMAAPGPASEAGWMFFVWATFTALCLITAYIANLWMRLPVSIPAALLSLLLLVLFLRKRAGALSTRR
ncbi:hypothetical protein BJF92_16695 [Rhizobium rhizosphaerae]|uniref:Uncharacterized protein n=1 Tax=Xaviernesmea rhizosphaerae TaxID=1672749 RepID=A0A1Q9AIK3_9HYPH|nr:hypothetical protein [Xaviernesmea rhizosphaerae]OLP55038.1 hypothetical protein BJF92_16695 [Xaviernesmea rhizosphaerae]